MSRFASLAIERAGLSDVISARDAGPLSRELKDRLERADLLVLGALSDQIRRYEVGDGVRVLLSDPKDDAAVLLPLASRPLGEDAGIHLLRDTAIARITSPKGATIRVSWADVGIEIALVALGFGANELVGRISNRRGLPLVEGAKVGWGKRSTYVPVEVAKKRELAGHIRQAGRSAVFVLADGTEEAMTATATTDVDAIQEEGQA